jgi:hypothetical protein
VVAFVRVEVIRRDGHDRPVARVPEAEVERGDDLVAQNVPVEIGRKDLNDREASRDSARRDRIGGVVRGHPAAHDRVDMEARVVRSQLLVQ